MCGCKINEENLKRKGEKIMKKMKKVFALLVAMVMVMGMTMTTMAAPKTDATITVKDENGANLEGADLSYVQVIVADQTTRTGWAFTSDAVKEAYLKAFAETDDQVVIDQLIAYAAKAENAATTEEIAKALSNVANSKDVVYETMTNPQTVDKAGVYAVKAVQKGYTYNNMAAIAKALSNVANSKDVVYETMTNPQTVDKAGVYAVKAVQKGYTYNNMAAYVGFTAEQGDYPSLTAVELTAKRTPVDITKEATDEDKVVAIGDIVTYTIKTTVPYIDPNATDKTFKVWDKISGAEYYLDSEDSVAIVKMGTDTVVGGAEIFELNENKDSFEIDLSKLILTDNANAGKDITVAYTAKVTAQTVENEVGSNISGTKVDSDNENVYTGSITLTKYNEDKSKKLAGAGFEVRKDGSDEALTFKKLGDGSYEYAPNGEITEVFTGKEGTLTVSGLDAGTYNFKETTAPEGYHIKNDPDGVDATATLVLEGDKTEAEAILTAGTELTNNFKETTAPEGYHIKNDPDGVDATATLVLEGDKTEAEAILTAGTELTNTKLSSLPSTGGIGTTIFTIGGCVIMIAAAGLFFASRRKESK